MKAKTGDFAGAMGDMERAVAIMLSLDLAQHPDIQSRGGDLAHFWKQSGNADKAARLRQGDISDLLLAIAQIELEHRAWVADNPGSRQFGPRSFFTWSNTIAGKNILWLNALATAGVSIEDFMARMRQGVPLDEIARFVAETISGNEAK